MVNYSGIDYPGDNLLRGIIYFVTPVWKRFTHVQRRDSSGKIVPTLYRCISVTDDIKINEQNKSIGIGPVFLQTEFEAN